MTEKKLPTRSEVESAIADELFHTDLPNLTVAQEIREVLERIGVRFGPEPVAAKRGDLLDERTELVDRLAVRDSDGEVHAYWQSHNTWYCADGIGEGFTTEQVINYQSRIIDVPGVVDTPEPAPKYVAERIDDEVIAVNSFRLTADRKKLTDEIARRQAALDLLDSEEAGK